MTAQSKFFDTDDILFDHVSKFIILLGLTPAIMTSLIAPRFWIGQFALCLGDCRPVRLMEPVFAGVPVYTSIAIAAFTLGLGLALVRRSRWTMLLLAPLILFALRGEIDAGIDSVLMPWFDESRFFAGEWIYNISTSFVFLYFVFSPSRVIRTPFFAAFVGFLILAMLYEPHFGMGEFLFFLASIVVARIVFLFISENLAMFARLGARRTATLFAKSLLLMVPIIMLIGVGEYIRQGAEAVVVNSVYSSRPLCAYRDWLAASETPYGTPDAVARAFADTTACPKLITTADPEYDPEDPIHQEHAETVKIARVKLPELHRNLKDHNPCGAFVFDTHRPEPHLERDLCYYTEYLHAGRAAALKKTLLEHKDGRAKLAADIRRDSEDAVNTALPPVTIYRKRRCESFPWLPCELKQAVLWVTHHAVNGTIDRTRTTIVQEVYDVVDRAERADTDVTIALNTEVDEATERMRQATRAALSNGFD
ncbi:MAG: hypothetical protein OER92_00385, partial [Alphaproteobacteria bacterium]|nr:hypothetical protein [Alphaproteobacteria bacterium]